MKKIGVLAIALLLFISLLGQETALLKFYVGTFTSEGAAGIYLCSFNPLTSEIKVENVFKGVDNPSFLKVSPNRKYLYVVTRAPAQIENSGGYVCAYQIQPNGNIEFLNKQVSNGADPCFVDVSGNGKHVAIATYNGGTTSLYPVTDDGKLLGATSVVKNKGASVNVQRQSAPHAHSIRFHPKNSQVFSADLGTDKLNIFYLEGDKLIQKNQEFAGISPGSGPRHFDFHPLKNIIYVINELNSTVTALKNESTNWIEFQTISTVDSSFKGENFCADIHVSADGRFLYGSNRGDNSIVVYNIDSISGKLIQKSLVSTQGNWPRNFALTPNGKFMLVANQKSDNISVFKINTESGIPEFTGKVANVPAPVCIEFL